MLDLSREGEVFVLRMDAGENRFHPDFVRAWNAALDEVEAAVFAGTTRQILGLSGLRKVAPFVVSVDPPSLVLSNCGSDPAVTASADRMNSSTTD